MNSSDFLIAIIEDEAPLRRFLRASLSVEGVRVTEAARAKDGLRLITQEFDEAFHP